MKRAVHLLLAVLVFSSALAARAAGDDARLESLAHDAAVRHAREEAEEPAWIAQLKARKLTDYFGTNGNDITTETKRRFYNDAMKLHHYFEAAAEPSDEANAFGPILQKYLKRLSAQDLKAAAPEAGLTDAAKDWALETFVVQKRVEFLAADPGFFKRALELVSGPHLCAVSKYGALVAVSATAAYAMRNLVPLTMHDAAHVGGEIGIGIGGFILGTIKSGPGATIMNAATGWFLTPTTEFIKVLNSRYTGKIEERINGFFDKFKTKAPAETSERNERPKIANIREDGTDFAGMTAEEQTLNWDKSMKMWVAVAKRFGQLLRDTHHSGRYLTMMSWSDEQAASTIIETMAAKIVSLDTRVELMLTPHETAFLIRGEREKKEDLERSVREYQALCKGLWTDPTSTEAALEKMTSELEGIAAHLEQLGLSKDDLAVLSDVEAVRAKAIGTLVTATAMNELRLFSVAESNRNLATEARRAQRAMRFGLNLQAYVEEYQPLVAHQISLMGYHHSGAPKAAKPSPAFEPLQCSELFDAE